MSLLSVSLREAKSHFLGSQILYRYLIALTHMAMEGETRMTNWERC